tara:strand:+ start:418 stop:540 length:123 start_codon:yes stop_codon:yes gene_type:complete
MFSFVVASPAKEFNNVKWNYKMRMIGWNPGTMIGCAPKTL